MRVRGKCMYGLLESVSVFEQRVGSMRARGECMYYCGF